METCCRRLKQHLLSFYEIGAAAAAKWLMVKSHCLEKDRWGVILAIVYLPAVEVPTSVGGGAHIEVNKAEALTSSSAPRLQCWSVKQLFSFFKFGIRSRAKEKSKTDAFYIMWRVNTDVDSTDPEVLRATHLDLRSFTVKHACRKYIACRAIKLCVSYTLFIYALFPLKRMWSKHITATQSWGYWEQLCFSCRLNLSCNDDAVLYDAWFCLSLSWRLSLVSLMLVWPIEFPNLCCVHAHVVVVLWTLISFILKSPPSESCVLVYSRWSSKF